MATLTATNKRVQFYLTYTMDKPTKALKMARMDALEKYLQEQNIMLDELFPSKQLQILDHILFITSAAGIAKVGADHLATKCECSVRTVYSAIRALKSTNQFIIGRLIKSQGGAGKYIIVDKQHENFTDILKEVFLLSNNKIAELNAEQFAGQKNSESVGSLSVECENQTSNINISLLKHTKNKYISGYTAIKEKIEKENDNSREYVALYASNPFQLAMYDMLDGFPLPQQIEKVKGIISLRVGSNADIRIFTKAKNLIIEMAKRITNGHKYENVVAAFSAGLQKSLEYDVPLKANTETNLNRKIPQFYNWLQIRE